jgi:hypothetical protein
MASLRYLPAKRSELRTRLLNPQLQAAAIRKFNCLAGLGFRCADRRAAEHLLASCLGILHIQGRFRTLLKAIYFIFL